MAHKLGIKWPPLARGLRDFPMRVFRKRAGWEARGITGVE